MVSVPVVEVGRVGGSAVGVVGALVVEVGLLGGSVAGGDVADAVDQGEGAAELVGGEAAELGDVEDPAGLVGQEAGEEGAGGGGEVAQQGEVDRMLAVAGEGGVVVEVEQAGQGDGDPDVEPAPARGSSVAGEESFDQDVRAGLGQAAVVVGVLRAGVLGGEGELPLDEQRLGVGMSAWSRLRPSSIAVMVTWRWATASRRRRSAWARSTRMTNRRSQPLSWDRVWVVA